MPNVQGRQSGRPTGGPDPFRHRVRDFIETAAAGRDGQFVNLLPEHGGYFAGAGASRFSRLGFFGCPAASARW